MNGPSPTHSLTGHFKQDLDIFFCFFMIVAEGSFPSYPWHIRECVHVISASNECPLAHSLTHIGTSGKT